MATSGTSNSALQAQLNALKEQVTAGFGDLKTMLQKFEDKLEGLTNRVQHVEQSEAVCQPMLMQRLGDTERKLKEHGERLSSIEKAVEQLATTNKILRWMLGIFTALLTTGLITLVARAWQVLLP